MGIHEKTLEAKKHQLSQMSGLADFASVTRTARRVLVIDSGFLGDTLHLVPALRELRRHYNDAEFHIVTTPVGAQVIGLANWADHIWTLEQSHPKRSLTAQLSVLRALRALHFDVSINFGDADRPTIYAGVVGARHRLGRMGARQHFWNSWCLPFRGPEPSDELPVFERHRQLLATAGFVLAPAQFNLSVPAADAEWAASTLPEPSVHLSPNTQSWQREWPISNWVKLIILFKTRHSQVRVVVTGSAAQRELERLNAIQSAASEGNALFFSNLSISKIAALMARSEVHVGSDSGALHLAVALGIPTVSFFRENPGIRGWIPRGHCHSTFIRPCACITMPTPRCTAEQGPECLASVTPESVLAAMELHISSDNSDSSYLAGPA